jgi:hypothetical protein
MLNLTYTYVNRDKTIGIHSKPSFIDALNVQSVLNLPSFRQVLIDAENLVKSENPGVSPGALGNVRGSWYEWLIALGFVEFRQKNPNSKFLLQLPNIRQYDCSKLYIERIYRYILDLRMKVSQTADVSLITSNPDFVIIDGAANISIPNITPGSVTVVDLVNLSQTFLSAEHLCLLDDITGYLAVKLSLRPDRRLQIAHEGSLMKAIYKHVQTREWLINAPGIQYYAITAEASDADRQALKTVATHSVTDVGSIPQAAVDDLFCVDSGAELEHMLGGIL